MDEVETYTFHVRVLDTANKTNGPNGRGCNLDQQESDSVPFDGVFECNCAGTTYEGDNCDQYVGSSMDSDSASDDTTFILVGVLALIVVVSAGSLFKIRHCPFSPHTRSSVHM